MEQLLSQISRNFLPNTFFPFLVGEDSSHAVFPSSCFKHHVAYYVM